MAWLVLSFGEEVERLLLKVQKEIGRRRLGRWRGLCGD